MTVTTSIPQCQHIKINGVQCGSPALKDRSFCYFHFRMRIEAARRRQAPLQDWTFPLLEDANSIQYALMQTLDAVIHNKLDRKTAALILYGLQTASNNLRHLEFEPTKAAAASEAGLSEFLLSRLDELKLPAEPVPGT
jgi:hypothetical protein